MKRKNLNAPAGINTNRPILKGATRPTTPPSMLPIKQTHLESGEIKYFTTDRAAFKKGGITVPPLIRQHIKSGEPFEGYVWERVSRTEAEENGFE